MSNEPPWPQAMKFAHFLQKMADAISKEDASSVSAAVKTGQTLSQECEVLVLEGMMIRGLQKKTLQKKLDLIQSQLDKMDESKIADVKIQPVLLESARSLVNKGTKRKKPAEAEVDIEDAEVPENPDHQA